MKDSATTQIKKVQIFCEPPYCQNAATMRATHKGIDGCGDEYQLKEVIGAV